MKKFISTTLAALATTLCFAQTLTPSGGVYYPGDANNSGIIRVEYADSVAEPTAVITFGNKSVTAPVYEQGNTGRLWAVQIEEALNSELTSNGTAINLAVTSGSKSVTGSYTYMPVFPLDTITPGNNSVLESKTASVVFNFNESVAYSRIRVISDGVTKREIAGGQETTLTVSLTPEDWGNPSNGFATVSVQIEGVTVDGNPISNVVGETNVIAANYFFEEVAAIEYLGYTPSNTERTYQQVWDIDWFVSFNYTEEPQLPYVEGETSYAATVDFCDANDDVIASIDLVAYDEVFCDYNRMLGCWSVQVAIPEVPTEAIGYVYADVTVQNLSYNGQALPSKTATYYAQLNNSRNGKKISTAGITSIESVSNTSEIYNINGIRVDNALENLPAGIYIVNGKKIAIK